jgi:hypothetical protein
VATPKTPARPGPPAKEVAGTRATDPILALVRRATAGDESSLPELRKLFDECPDSRFVNEVGGDMARTAEDSMIARAAGKNLVAREALRRKLAALRAELAGPTPTPIERLLAERAALCWLAVYEFEAAAAQQLGPIALALADYYQRRIDRAHKRYLTALRTLATVRKLAVPALQVNIGRNQRINHSAG